MALGVVVMLGDTVADELCVATGVIVGTAVAIVERVSEAVTITFVGVTDGVTFGELVFDGVYAFERVSV